MRPAARRCRSTGPPRRERASTVSTRRGQLRHDEPDVHRHVVGGQWAHREGRLRHRDGTATVVGSDYVAKSGALSFAPDVTPKTLTVAINGDTVREANETLSVNLSTPLNVTAFDGTG